MDIRKTNTSITVPEYTVANPSPFYENLNFTAGGSGTLTITGNGTNSVSIFKANNNGAWDTHAYTATEYTAPVTLEFEKQAAASDNGASYAMIGFNTDPTTDASYTSLDYASYPYQTSSYNVYHNGSQVNSTGTWSTSNKFYVVYGTDGFIRHYNGSTLLYSVNYGRTNTVYIDSSFYSVNSTFGGFSNIRLSRREWNGNEYVNTLSVPSNIDRNGLTLYLDATNRTSYNAGSYWVDLAQGLEFVNATGTQTPYQRNGAVPSFTFNNSGYWVHSRSPSSVDFGGDCTLIMWFYPTTLAARKTIFEKAGTTLQSYQQEIAVTWETNQQWSWYSRATPGYDSGVSGSFSLNAWQMMAIKMSTGRTSAARTGFYSINGASWIANYTSNSNTALTTSGEIRIGSGYAGTVTNGGVGMVMSYNRMLSDSEISNIYTATREKFNV